MERTVSGKINFICRSTVNPSLPNSEEKEEQYEEIRYYGAGVKKMMRPESTGTGVALMAP